MDRCESLAALVCPSTGEGGLTSGRASALGLATLMHSNESGLFHPSSLPTPLPALPSTISHSASPLVQALLHAILSRGGEVLKVSAVKELLGEAGAVTGVEVYPLDTPSGQTRELLARRGVISGLGAIHTYLRLLPGQALQPATAAALSRLCEARPKIRVVYWISGTGAELGMSAVDYIEVRYSTVQCRGCRLVTDGDCVGCK